MLLPTSVANHASSSLYIIILLHIIIYNNIYYIYTLNSELNPRFRLGIFLSCYNPHSISMFPISTSAITIQYSHLQEEQPKQVVCHHLECKNVKSSYNRCAHFVTHQCLVTGSSLRKMKNQFMEDISSLGTLVHSFQKPFLLCTKGKLACVCLCVYVCACMSACMENRLLCNPFEILLTETCSESSGVCVDGISRGFLLPGDGLQL